MYESFPTVDIDPRYLNMFSLLLQKALESITSSSDSQECNNFQAQSYETTSFLSPTLLCLQFRTYQSHADSYRLSWLNQSIELYKFCLQILYY